MDKTKGFWEVNGERGVVSRRDREEAVGRPSCSRMERELAKCLEGADHWDWTRASCHQHWGNCSVLPGDRAQGYNSAAHVNRAQTSAA